MRGVDCTHHLGERRPFRVDAEPLARPDDVGRLVAQRLEQPRNPVSAGRRADEQRHDLPRAQFFRQVVEHNVARRLDVAKQLLHQLVVEIGEALEHAIARALLVGRDAGGYFDHFGRRRLAVNERALERQVDEARRQPVLQQRDLAQQQRRAGSRLQQFQGLANAAAGEIDLV